MLHADDKLPCEETFSQIVQAIIAYPKISGQAV